MLFSNIFNFNLSFEDSSMKIETLRMFANKLRRDVKVLEERKEIERLLARGREREREKCSVKNARGKSIADALEKSLPFLGE